MPPETSWSRRRAARRPPSRAGALLVGGCLLLYLTGVSAEAPLPPSIHVGDGTLDGSALQPYDNVWQVNVRYTDGRRDERGLSSDHVRYREIDGKRYLTRVEGTTSVVGAVGARPDATFSMTFNVFDPVTLAPLSGYETASTNAWERNEFGARHVLRTSHPGTSSGAEVRATLELPEAVYDFNGGMTGLLLAALPLKVGYHATLPALGDNGFETAEVRVVREETVSAGHLGSRRAFVVEIGAAPARSIYWISKAVPYVIKVEVRAPNAVASWDML